MVILRRGGKKKWSSTSYGELYSLIVHERKKFFPLFQLRRLHIFFFFFWFFISYIYTIIPEKSLLARRTEKQEKREHRMGNKKKIKRTDCELQSALLYQSRYYSFFELNLYTFYIRLYCIYIYIYRRSSKFRNKRVPDLRNKKIKRKSLK